MQQHHFLANQHNGRTVAGADGCPGGWVVATREGVIVVSRLARVDHRPLGVDMPIGLPIDGPRACDIDARRTLGPRRSSVFPTPPRVCLDARDHAEAVALARAATGVGISLQAYHLMPKIAEVDALVRPDDEDAIVEVHPECAFTIMNGGVPLPSKKTTDGAAARAGLLVAEFGELPRVPRGARLDDLLDAYAVLWSTERFATGRATTFGDGRRDARGLTMRIVA